MISVSEVKDFAQCLEDVEKVSSVEKQLSISIEFMKNALSQGQKARFRDFWRMKKVCLELFKKDMPKSRRLAFWEEYTELLTEAHALQHILEEQVDFQSEQITLAIEGLEKDLAKGPQKVSNETMQCLKNLERGNELIELQNLSLFYHRLRELSLSYRKEILALEIRISQKNKLLAKLTCISDKIFPERKRLFSELTKIFSEVVSKFINSHFVMEEGRVLQEESVFSLRAKIKSFQSALKLLSISNEAYGKARKTFSECWEILKKSESEEKLLLQKRKQDAPTEVSEELEEINACCSEVKLIKLQTTLVGNAKEKGASKEALFLLNRGISAKIKELEKELLKQKEALKIQEELQAESKAKHFVQMMDDLTQLKAKSKRMKMETIQTQFNEVCDSLSGFSLSKREEAYYRHKRQMISMLLIQKKEKNEDVLELYQQLHAEIKESIEENKKLKSECGLDIELAIELGECIQEAKELVKEIESHLEQYLVSIE